MTMNTAFLRDFPALNFEDLEATEKQTIMKHKKSGELFEFTYECMWKIVDTKATEKQTQQHWYDMITRHFC